MTTNLNDYRARKAAAMAYHPSSVRPIWTPTDAIETAQAFAAEIHHAERGIPDAEPAAARPTGKLFGRSRFRRARIYDGLAVTLLVALMAALGVIVWAASAHADDPDAQALAFASRYGGAVCHTLDDHATVAGVYGAGLAIMDKGLTAEQAGQAIAISVIEQCPRHLGLLQAFLTMYAPVTA